MKVYYFKKDMRNVTEYYYNIILSGLRKRGAKIIELNVPSGKIKKFKKSDLEYYIKEGQYSIRRVDRLEFIFNQAIIF